MGRFFTGTPGDTIASVDARIQELEDRIAVLEKAEAQREKEMEWELVRPELEGLIAEYREFGGQVEYHIVKGRIAHSTKWTALGFLREPDYLYTMSADEFRLQVLLPQMRESAR